MAEAQRDGTVDTTNQEASNVKANEHTRKSIQALIKKSRSVEDAHPSPDPVHGACKRSSDCINGLMIQGTSFRVGRIIGRGFTGQVRLVRNIKTNQIFAVKLDTNDTGYPILEKEWDMYKKLHARVAPGIAKVFHLGKCGVHQALVLELLGPSLQEIFSMSERKFSLHTILLLAIQLITRLQYIHSKKIIHRDIKPENFLIAKPPSRDNTIFIVDFGLAKYYINPRTKKHIVSRGHKTLAGTANFMSLNTHMGMEQSRRDDLESLGYCLIYFLRGNLPWEDIRRNFTGEELHEQIVKAKGSINLEKLCEGHPPEFVEYMEYVRNLRFEQSPDYSYLRRKFTQRLEKKKYDPNGNLDWRTTVGNEKLINMSDRLHR